MNKSAPANSTAARKLQHKLESYSPAAPITPEFALEAEQNLSGFLATLIKINNREKIVSADALAKTPEVSHAR